MRGFNWFGFDVAQTCVDGLYAGNTALSRDLVTVIRTQQALGFNAVRLLTSFGTIFGLPPVPQSRSCTPVSPADYQAYLTDPTVAVAAGATIPELAVIIASTPLCFLKLQSDVPAHLPAHCSTRLLHLAVLVFDEGCFTLACAATTQSWHEYLSECCRLWCVMCFGAAIHNICYLIHHWCTLLACFMS